MNVPANFNECLGNAVRAYRKQAGLSQAGLAEKAGLTRRFIQELENGRSDVSLQTLYRLTAAMEMRVPVFLAGVEELIANGKNT